MDCHTNGILVKGLVYFCKRDKCIMVLSYYDKCDKGIVIVKCD